MSVTLVALSEGPDLSLDKPVMLLGRHGECDVQLHSGKISRRHCIVAYVDDRVVVRDLGSTNGVRINGKRVVEGNLADGDELAIGNFCYRVQLGRGEQRAEDAALESSDVPVALTEDGAEAPVAKKLPQDTFTQPDM
ncbi:MAG: FHA domain-containing protein [Gemmataceae bacterium]